MYALEYLNILLRVATSFYISQATNDPVSPLYNRENKL